VQRTLDEYWNAYKWICFSLLRIRHNKKSTSSTSYRLKTRIIWRIYWVKSVIFLVLVWRFNRIWFCNVKHENTGALRVCNYNTVCVWFSLVSRCVSVSQITPVTIIWKLRCQNISNQKEWSLVYCSSEHIYCASGFVSFNITHWYKYTGPTSSIFKILYIWLGEVSFPTPHIIYITLFGNLKMRLWLWLCLRCVCACARACVRACELD